MWLNYLQAALHQAQYKVVEEQDRIYATIPGFEGVQASGESLEECRRHLAEVLEDWIEVRVSRKLPLPEVNGVSFPEQL
jgi:predicted RNase H-like HicB family nuclease